MKKAIYFLLICSYTLSFGQSNFKMSLVNTLDYSFLEPLDRENSYDSSIDYKMPLGYSIDLGFEFGNGDKHAFQTGLRYSKKNFYPDLEVAFWYGGILAFEDDTIHVQVPRLKKLSFETIAIPISHKHYFKQGNHFAFYIQTGAVVSISLSKEEHYREKTWGFTLPPESTEADDLADRTITAKGRQFKLYGTAIQLGGGMTCKINKSLALVLQAHAHFFELRKANKQLVEAWPYSGFEKTSWEKDDFIPLGQLSVGLGLMWDL